MKYCARCNKQFSPQKPHYRYCETCFAETQSIGFTHHQSRPGRPDHTTGGISRLRDDRHSITLQRGHETTAQIVVGLNNFLSDLHRQPFGLNRLWRKYDLPDKKIAILNEPKYLSNFVMQFCPELERWLTRTVGFKAKVLIIGHYGLYGHPCQTLGVITQENNLDINNPEPYFIWAMKEICKHQHELDELIVSQAENTLPS